MKQILFAALIVSAFSGCATQDQGKQFTACLEANARNPAFAPIASKIALGGVQEQSLSMLSSKETASDADRVIISKWNDGRKQCYANASTAMQDSMHPRLYGLVAKAESQRQQLISRLYSGAITYGQFAEGRQIIQDLFEQDRLALASAAVDQQAEQRRQVLLMQLQTQLNKPTGNAPMPAPYMMPSPAPAPASTTTNCTTFGNQVNCVSR